MKEIANLWNNAFSNDQHLQFEKLLDLLDDDSIDTQELLLAPIISYTLINNFTEESLVAYLKKKYSLDLPDPNVYPDPNWFGRGALKLTKKDFDKIPSNWEKELSECYDELEFIEEDED